MKDIKSVNFDNTDEFSPASIKISLFGPLERRISLLGIDGCGKTHLIYPLSGNTIPTIGYNNEEFEYGETKFSIYDVGGSKNIRSLWVHYFTETINNNQFIYCPIVYFIDPSNRVEESLESLKNNILIHNINSNILLVLNRYFKGPSIEEFTSLYKLSDLLKGQSWKIIELEENENITSLLKELDFIVRKENIFV